MQMAGIGPAPTPTAILKLRGNPHVKRKRRGEPAATTGKPRDPEWFSAEAKSLFDRCVTIMSRMDMLGEIDEFSLVRFSNTYVRWCRVCQDIDEQGEEVGLVRLEAGLSATLGKLEPQLGMTPSGRTRIRVESKPKADKSKARFFGESG